MLEQDILVAVFLKQNFPQSEDSRFCTALSTSSCRLLNLIACSDTDQKNFSVEI